MSLGQRPRSQAVAPRGDTARRILEHARKAFNERGVAAVGIRDLARELNLSPGNLSYHFATKEALIAALVEDVHATNNAAATPSGPLDFVVLDQIIRTIMRRDIEHRWFMREFAGLVLSLPTLRASHERMQRGREARVDGIVTRLIEGKLVEPDADWALFRVQILTQIMFWVPAALIAAPDRDPIERLDLHARAALALFRPYATAAGRRQLARLIAPPG